MSVQTPVATGQPATKSDYAYSRLRQGILAGDHPPGAVLNQALLAEAIGISTTPLREALRRLNAEGLVELESHRDARVSALTADEARGILEMRRALDPVALELAALRRTEEDIRRILAAHERLDLPGKNGAVIDVRAHRDFHTVLYQTSHNKLLVSTLDSLWDKAERYRLLGQQTTASDEDLAQKKQRKAAEHAELVDSVLRGDAERAADVMRRHISHSLLTRAADSLSSGESTGELAPR